MRVLFIMLFITSTSLFAETATLGNASLGNASLDHYFSESPPLSSKDQKLVNKAQEWIDSDSQPQQQRGKITYDYGEGQATLICAPLKLCVLELEDGEQVSKNGIHIGDNTRWIISPSIGYKEKTVLIVKPADVGLETTLALVTNKRVYNVRLISQLHNYTPIVAFQYPADAQNPDAWHDYHQQEARRAAKLKEQQALAAKERAIVNQRMAELRKQEVAAQKDVWKIRQEATQQREALEALRRRQEVEYRQSLVALDAAHRARMEQQQRQHYELALQAEEELAAYKKTLIEQEKQRLQAVHKRNMEKINHQQVNHASSQQVRQPHPKTVSRTPSSMVGNLDFRYAATVCERCLFKPIQVFNNGSQTVIEMDGALNHEAPALMVLGSNGQQSLVNYRLVDNRYIVDAVFNEAVLVSGAGKQQQEIFIKRVPKDV